MPYDFAAAEARMNMIRFEISDLWDEYVEVRNNRGEGYLDRTGLLMNSINVLEGELSRLEREHAEQLRALCAPASGGSPIPE